MKHPQTIGGIWCHYIFLKISSTKLCSIGTCYLDSYHMGKARIMAAEAVVFPFSPKKTTALSVSITIYVNLVNLTFYHAFSSHEAKLLFVLLRYSRVDGQVL